MKILQPSFSRGEVSPEMQARTDLAAYPLGLKTCRNFQVRKFGGVENRAGFEYITDYVTGATDNGEAVNLTGEEINFLIPFKPNDDAQYTVLITEKYIVPLLNGEFLEADDCDVWLSTETYNINDYVQHNGETYVSIRNDNTNNTPSNTSDEWQHTNDKYYLLWPFWRTVTFRPSRLSYVQSIDVLYICNDHARAIGDDQQAIPPFELRRLSTSPNRWEIVPYDFKNGPFLDMNTDDSIYVWASRRTGRITISSNKPIFDALHVDSFFKMQSGPDIGIARITAFTSTTSVSALVLKKIPEPLTSTSQVYAQRGGTLTGNGSTTVFTITGASSSVSKEYVVSVTEVFYAGYNEYAVHGTSYTMDSGLYTVDGTADTITFTVAPPDTATIKVYEKTVANPTNPTSLWAFGAWSPYQGYPELVNFFHDRLVFARTILQPDAFWMSRAGNLVSHEIEDPVTDASAISRIIASREVNKINEIVPLDKLIFLTTDVEWILTPGQNEVITPVGISLKPQSHLGSADMNAEIIGNLCVYLQAKSNVIRNFSFTYESNSFTSEDLTLFASHLFEGYTVLKVAFQKTPNQSLWVVRSDGKLLCMTYLPEQDVVAWSRHDTMNGEFLDITVIEEDNRDVLYALVQRDIDDEDVIYLERMKPRYFAGIEDAFFVDSGLTYDGRNVSEPTTWNLQNAVLEEDSTELPAGINPNFSGLFIKPDGTKIFSLQASADNVRTWVLPDPWILDRALLDKSTTFSVNAQETSPTAFFVKPDGTKFYVVGTTADTVFQYSMDPTWVVETATYDAVSFSVAAQCSSPTGLFFRDNGAKMYVMDGATDTIFQYTLSNPWVVSSASYDGVSFSVAAQDTGAGHFIIKDDGTKLYVLGTTNERIYQYSLPTPWILTGASYDSISLNLSTDIGFPDGFWFKPDGTRLFVLDDTADSAFSYTITADLLKTMTLTGSGWTVDDQLTLTAAGTGNAPFTASNVEDYVYLEIRNDDDEVTDEVRVKINGVTSSTVATVVPQKTVPSALRGVATADWVFAVDTITGLDHLEGETVSILADGDVQEQKTVSGGSITLEIPAGKVQVGLPIEADAETLELNVQNAEPMREKKKRIPRVTLSLKDTRGVKVGTTFDKLYPVKQRQYEGYEESTELMTDIAKVNIETTWNNSGRICIRQSDPLPATILSLTPDVEVAGS